MYKYRARAHLCPPPKCFVIFKNRSYVHIYIQMYMYIFTHPATYPPKPPTRPPTRPSTIHASTVSLGTSSFSPNKSFTRSVKQRPASLRQV